MGPSQAAGGGGGSGPGLGGMRRTSPGSLDGRSPRGQVGACCSGPTGTGELGQPFEEPLSEFRLRAHSTGERGQPPRSALARKQPQTCSREQKQRTMAKPDRKWSQARKETDQDGRCNKEKEMTMQRGEETSHPAKVVEEKLAGRPEAAAAGEESLRERNRNLKVMNKRCFSCVVLGSRRSGKRTIVKCFIKLLNEFKLAASEYKKEKMLTRLIDCSEQLQDIADRRREELEAIKNAAQQTSSEYCRQKARLRGGSWFGGLLNQLPMAANVTKRRLHSFVGTTSTSNQGPGFGLSSPMRRHTAIEDTCFIEQPEVGGQMKAGPRSELQASGDGRPLTSGKFLAVEGSRNCNKSDFNINYLANEGGAQIKDDNSREKQTEEEQEEEVEDVISHKLQVPEIDWPALVPSTDYSRSNLELDKTGEVATTSGPGGKYSMARRSTQLLASEQATRATKRPLLSLKEINRRKVRIRFKTRRYLSERYFDEAPGAQAEVEAPDSELPDAFLVVYAVNDRRSFEFAKSVVCKLESLRKKLPEHSPLPVVLVANKIDLERAKVIRSEEARTLAKRNGCKFVEVSCTIGFNLDNLLVGLRTQLVLKHHVALNWILKNNGKAPPKAIVCDKDAKTSKEKENSTIAAKSSTNQETQPKAGNILTRFYKRFVVADTDDETLNYESDNFSKL